MKFGKCLLIASQALVFTACAKNKDLPERKDGYTCNITYKKDNNAVKVVNGSHVAAMDEEFRCSFNIAYVSDQNADWNPPPTKDAPNGKLDISNKEYYIPHGGITVKIGGKEYPDSFNFYYINNTSNTLIIKKEYMVNDVEIEINTKCIKDNTTDPDSSSDKILTLYGIEFSETIAKRIAEESIETPVFASKYQNHSDCYIKILKQEAYPVFQDDSIDLTLTAPSGKEKLPNIVVRTGAHYAIEGVEYTIEYSADKMSCHIIVPNYVVRDHLSFAAEGEK